MRGENPNSKGVEGVGYTGVYACSDAAEGEGVHGRGTAAKGSPGLVVQHDACLPLELRQP